MEKTLRTWRVAKGMKLDDAAKMIGVTEAMLSRWETGTRRVPAERVPAIERITGIPRNKLRPDIFEAAQ